MIKISNIKYQISKSQGVTLIELVVALTLGSLIMMAIVAMYSSSTKMLFNSVKGYQNQVEASLAVENIARRIENAVWVEMPGGTVVGSTVEGTQLCIGVEVDDTGSMVGSKSGLKDSGDNYHEYSYDATNKQLLHSACTDTNVGTETGCDTCGSAEVLASDIIDLKFIQQGLNAQSATQKNVMYISFTAKAATDAVARQSKQVTKINLRGRGSYGYYD